MFSSSRRARSRQSQRGRVAAGPKVARLPRRPSHERRLLCPRQRPRRARPQAWPIPAPPVACPALTRPSGVSSTLARPAGGEQAPARAWAVVEPKPLDRRPRTAPPPAATPGPTPGLMRPSGATDGQGIAGWSKKKAEQVRRRRCAYAARRRGRNATGRSTPGRVRRSPCRRCRVTRRVTSPAPPSPPCDEGRM